MAVSPLKKMNAPIFGGRYQRMPPGKRQRAVVSGQYPTIHPRDGDSADFSAASVLSWSRRGVAHGPFPVACPAIQHFDRSACRLLAIGQVRFRFQHLSTLRFAPQIRKKTAPLSFGGARVVVDLGSFHPHRVLHESADELPKSLALARRS